MQIKIVQGDITTFEVDAIVNAANSTLLGGGGVDGAIHRAAGKELLEECREIRRIQLPNGLPTGQTVMTKGYNLKAKYVIHTVGPVYSNANVETQNLSPRKRGSASVQLAQCYENSLKLAEENNCKSIAFPAISTGIYMLPIELSAKTVKEVMQNYKSEVVKEVYLVLYGKADYDVYMKEFKQ